MPSNTLAENSIYCSIFQIDCSELRNYTVSAPKCLHHYRTHTCNSCIGYSCTPCTHSINHFDLQQKANHLSDEFHRLVPIEENLNND